MQWVDRSIDRRRAARRAARWAGTALGIGFVSLGLLWPLLRLARTSFADPWWQEYADLLGSQAVRTILLRTLWLAVVATVITLLVAYPAAYRIATAGERARKIILGLLVLPYLTSLLVRTYAWIGLIGARGPVTGALRAAGFDVRSLVGTGTGVMLVLIHVFLPLMIFTIYVSMTKVDPAHLHAAHSLGAHPAEAFVRVYMPQTKPGVVGAVALVFTITAAMYATPALIGGTSETTLAVLIFDQISQLPPSRWAGPAALSGLLFVTVALVLLMAARAIGAGALFGLGGNADRYRPRRAPKAQPGPVTEIVGRAAGRLPASLPGPRLSSFAVAIALVVVDVPLLYMVGVSFQPLRLVSFPTDGLSGRWYREVISDPQWLAAARSSLFIALVATVVAVTVGAFLADQARRGSAGVRRAVTALALAPLLVPHIFYAVAMYQVFIDAGLVGNSVAIGVVHAALALPFTYVNLLNGFASYDPAFDNAASSLGAGRLRRLQRVKLPLLLPAILVASAFAFLTSFDDYISTALLGGIGFRTLPVRFFAAAQQDLSPELAVVGTLILVVVGAAALLLTGLRARIQPSRDAPAPEAT